MPGETCKRCGGLMVQSDFDSLLGDMLGAPLPMWRCVNCGERLDALILANRRKRGTSPRILAGSLHAASRTLSEQEHTDETNETVHRSG